MPVAAAAMPMAAAAMKMLRRGWAWRHGESAGNQGRDCEEFHEFRHGRTSNAPKTMNDNLGSSLRAGYRHQHCICGTITGPLTRYSLANQERQYRLE